MPMSYCLAKFPYNLDALFRSADDSNVFLVNDFQDPLQVCSSLEFSVMISIEKHILLSVHIPIYCVYHLQQLSSK